MSGRAWVTGMGVISALGTDPGAIPPPGADDHGALVDDRALDALCDHLPQRHLRHADRAGRLAVAAAREALARAGCRAPRADIGCAFGIDYGTYPANFAYQRRLLAEGPRLASPAEFTLTLPNITTSFVSIVFGLRGPSATVADGGVAAGTALGLALDWIRAGAAERVLVGAAEPRDAEAPALRRPPLARHPDRPEHGVAWLLESPAAARARGVRAMAAVVGYGAARDAETAWRAATADASAADGPPPGAPTDLWHLSGAVARLQAPLAAYFGGHPPQARVVVLEPCA